ncbi:MAG: hypothetical protein OEZ38_14130 [Gammaproteobacteria bacterium]|nr:hypothetical protein [Gammaproteobacteria bacterium]
MSQLSYENLTGHWQRVSQTPDDVSLYPEQIEFRSDGCYLTVIDNEVFYEWQAGDYEIIDDSNVKIESSTDAMLTYKCYFENKVLNFINADGVKVTYQRMAS